MIRIGTGYDAHRLKKGRKLVLGGVLIPYPKGLEGHSDADVLIHAMADALLGAGGLGDIGTYFSNKDPRWRNASSLIFLQKIQAMFKKKKIRIQNIDCVLLSEEPRIGPYVSAMKSCISVALKIQTSQIGIKASTNEQMGFVGRKQGMAAHAVALIQGTGSNVQ